jgi:hypothetical protein
MCHAESAQLISCDFDRCWLVDGGDSYLPAVATLLEGRLNGVRKTRSLRFSAIGIQVRMWCEVLYRVAILKLLSRFKSGKTECK